MKHRFCYLLIAVMLLATVIFAGCTPGGKKMNTYTQIDQATAMEMMAQDDGHVIVDVRRQDEYDAGHIPGAILIPNESIEAEQPEELPDLDQIILIYCRSGNRSKQAAEKLVQIGYTNIYEFGGINTWTGEIVTKEAAKGDASSEKQAVLQFSSFDGGGHEYTAEIEDPSIVSCTSERDYGTRDELEDGSPYTEIFTFTGLKEGSTTVYIYGRSPIADNDDSIYTANVDKDLNISLVPVRKISTLFVYRHGEINYPSYNLTSEPDGYYVSVSDGPAQKIDAAAADALMNVINDYNLASWDGFDESRSNVLDGEGFSIEIAFTDGTSITANGDNAFPENYFDAMAEIYKILGE